MQAIPAEVSARRARLVEVGALALVALVFALYFRTRAHGFVAYDDPVYVSENEMVGRGLTREGLRWAFGFHAGNWHPLTWLAHMLDVELFALDAGRHHLVNAALHALNAGLCFLVLARWTGAAWSALAISALFALHPLRVESVAWAAEKKDVLAGTFWFLTLLGYERYARRGGGAWFALTALCFALGLMAKSMLVTLPLVLLLADRWPLARAKSPRLVLEKLPFFTLALATGWATLWIQRQEGAVGTLQSLSLIERASNACLSTWVYLEKTFLPTGLACFVPHPVAVTPREELTRVLFLPGLLALLGLVLVTALCVRLRHRRPHLLFGWSWYLIVAAPVIGLVQVGQQAYADRYTYLPTLGIVLALVFELRAWAAEFSARRRVLAVALTAALGALLPLTMGQIDTWRDSRTLFRHAYANVPNNYLAATFLGQVERRAGELSAARAHFETALAANKYHVPAMVELGLTLEDLGELGAARKALKRALRNDPASAPARAALERVERLLEGREEG